MNVALRPQSLDILSICTGGGGLDLGIELAVPGARSVCMVEREAFAVAHLVSAMEQGLLAPAPVWSDARTFDGRRWRGCVDGLIGGIPCQPHSLAGRKQGQLDARDLWSDARRIIVQSRVWWALIENVGGMLAAGADEVAGAERVWRDLRKLGFAVEIGLFTAAEVGASHERERVFILGVADRNDAGLEGYGRSVECPGERPAWPGGSELADAANRRRDNRPTSGECDGSTRQAGGCGGALADAHGSRRPKAGSGHPFDAGQQPEPGRSVVDHADSGRRPARRDDHGSHVRIEPCAAGQHALVHSEGHGRREGRTEPGIRPGWNAAASGTGQSMDDASVTRGRRLSVQPRRQKQARSDADRTGGHVGHADDGSSQISQGDETLGGGRAVQPAGDRPASGDLGVFPPGPADLDGWRRVLAHSPDLEPAVRRMADGVAARVDLSGPHAARVELLRLLGNGVVSLEGAHAFRTLCHRLAGRGSAGAASLVRMMGELL